MDFGGEIGCRFVFAVCWIALEQLIVPLALSRTYSSLLYSVTQPLRPAAAHMAVLQCPFPYTDWPDCHLSAANQIGVAYWIFVSVMAVLNLVALIPTVNLLVRTWQRRNEESSENVLDRPGSVRARLAFALLFNVVLIPDPIGIAGLLPVDFIELVVSFSAALLLSILLSLGFRWVRGLLLLSNSLNRLNLVTRLYMRFQYISMLVWIAFPLVQVLVSPKKARIFKCVPLLYSVMLITSTFLAAIIFSLMAMHRMRTEASKGVVSTVTSQRLSRMQQLLRNLMCTLSVIVLFFVPITVERVVVLISAPCYPNTSSIDTLSELLKMASFRILTLAFACSIAFRHALARHEVDDGNRLSQLPMPTTNLNGKDGIVSLEMISCQKNPEAGGGGLFMEPLPEQRRVSSRTRDNHLVPPMNGDTHIVPQIVG